MNRFAIRTLSAFTVLMGMGFLSTQSRAQEAETTEVPVALEETVVDPQAEQVIHAMIDYLKTLDAVKLQGSINMSLNMEGEVREMANIYQITIARPAQISVRGEGAPDAGTMVADGQQVYFYVPVTGKYIVAPQPESFDVLLDDPMASAMSNGVGGMIGMLWHSQAYEKFMANVTQVQYVGEETVDNQTMHHMRFVQPDGKHDLWITAGEHPTLARIVPDTSGGTEDPSGESVDLKITINFTNWQANPTLDEQEFVFTPPAEAQKADSFFEEPPVETLEEEPTDVQVSP